MGGNSPLPSVSDQPLVPELPPRPSFAQRIERAHDLSGRFPSAVDILGFYARLAHYQQDVFNALPAGKQDSSEPWPLVIEVALPLFSAFAHSLAEISPQPMCDRAAQFAVCDPVEQGDLLTRFWAGDFEKNSPGLATADRFIALAFLQPYAEWLVQSGHILSAATRHDTCPVCASKPACAVLRDRGHGAGRSLVCSLCMHEWSYLRVLCPVCGEDRFESLPVFTPEEIPQVRIDACETCRHYIKTIDMTKDGRAVPIVDELATIPLDLWATEKGYQKLTLNLAGF
jgi:formate dehydrogenase accessory protein FdhE